MKKHQTLRGLILKIGALQFCLLFLLSDAAIAVSVAPDAGSIVETHLILESFQADRLISGKVTDEEGIVLV